MGLLNFEDELMAFANDLCSNVKNVSADCVGIGSDFCDRRKSVLLEGLEQKESDQHQVVVGAIVSQSLKRKLFGAELLEGAVGQLVCAALVVTVQNGFGFCPVFLGVFIHRIKRRVPSFQIGENDVVWRKI